MNIAMKEGRQIEIYRSDDGRIELSVMLENNTVWLSQSQMAQLFGRERSVISRHINNCYREGELDKNITCAKYAHMGADNDQCYETTVYNLDVIISVGYRVKSVNGTRFRQWASRILRDYIVSGYAVSDKLKAAQYAELKTLVALMSRTVERRAALPHDDEAEEIIRLAGDYVYALDTLDNYDYQALSISNTTVEQRFRATYDDALGVIRSLGARFGGSQLFARRKDDSLHSCIDQVYQTFDGKDLYPSVEEKAAVMLYLIVKDHPFVDGNKRIAATLFLWFMERNAILYRPDGTKRIADNTLVALTLMIAESRVEEKDLMIKVAVSLINRNNT